MNRYIQPELIWVLLVCTSYQPFPLNGMLFYFSDGVGQDQLSCLKEFRNRPHAVRLRIIRMRGTLEVSA